MDLLGSMGSNFITGAINHLCGCWKVKRLLALRAAELRSAKLEHLHSEHIDPEHAEGLLDQAERWLKDRKLDIQSYKKADFLAEKMLEVLANRPSYGKATENLLPDEKGLFRQICMDILEHTCSKLLETERGHRLAAHKTLEAVDSLDSKLMRHDEKASESLNRIEHRLSEISRLPQDELPVKLKHERGDLQIFHVFHPRNPNFTGREKLLTDLNYALDLGKTTALTQTRAVHGLGGVGKTQLATEYAYRNQSNYGVVWWVRSEDSATLGADYAGLAAKLGLEERNEQDQTVIVEAVRRWLEGNSGWLLIFDNVVEQKDLGQYLPRGGGKGHIIITSRNPNWGQLAEPLEVQPFDRRESIHYLLKRTKSKNNKAAAKVADVLGDFPLALAQGAGYMEATKCSLAEYLKLFETQRRELWKDEKPPAGYEATVETTWVMAFKRLENESPTAVALLRLCAFLAPDDIPLDVITQQRERLPEPLASAAAAPVELNRAIAALREYSLAERSNATLSVHRLVQAVTRDQMSEDERQSWIEHTVTLIGKALPEQALDVRDSSECAKLLAHALAATGHAEKLDVAPAMTGFVLNQIGGYVWGWAEFAQARRLYERALAIYEKIYGPEDPEVATILNNLGLVLQDLAELKGAKKLFERALATNEKVYGSEHPKVAINVNHLGTILHDLGDFEGAKRSYERALQIDEKALGPDHPDVAIRVNNLGMVLRDLGDLQRSKRLLERALEIDEKAFGPNHPDVAIRVNNLGLVLRDLGDLEGARKQFERALVISEKTLSPKHPALALRLNNLGLILQDLRDFEAAEELYTRAIEIDERAFGPEHPQLALKLNNLAMLLKDMGDIKGAKKLLERALAMLAKSLGEKHPTTAMARQNLKILLREFPMLRESPQTESD